MNLTGSARWKMVGFDPTAGELELGVSAGRKFGPVLAMLGLTAGRDTQAVGGNDVEALGLTDVAVASWASVGVEGRFRAGRDPDNFPVFGSAWDVVGGAHGALKFGPVRVQGLVGYGGGAGPNAQLRGLGRPGPCGMLNVSGDIT